MSGPFKRSIVRGLRSAVCCLSLVPAASFAQQDPMYSQYMFNTLAFNPAYAGSADVISLMALSRHQWVGFEGAPRTQTLSGNSPLPNESIAVGALLVHDKAGPATQTGFFADLAYRMRTGADTRLAFGMQGGVDLYSVDLASLSTVEVDPANAVTLSEALPNFGFGLFWHAPRYYVGLSAPKLLTNEIQAVEQVLTTARQARHYFLIGGYVFDLNRDMKFKPSIMLRAVEGAPLSLDINAHFLLRERIWFGAMMRLGNSFGVMAQYQINDQFKAGYAFDLTTSQLSAYNAGTHELMIGYDLRFSRGRTISPRYF